MKQSTASPIKTKHHNLCYICNSKGNTLYAGLEDTLFNIRGKWDIKICQNPECGLLWLDPMPVEEDVYKLYDTYYTHSEDLTISDFKKKKGIQLILHHIYSLLDIMTLTKYEKNILNHFYLHKTKPGRLLEIGCGNGKRLNEMKLLGWNVEGQEIDPKAASFAEEKYGLKIHIGNLNVLNLKNEHYDAVVLNHVLEHIYNPLHIIRKCISLLKNDGKLIIITPNSKSIGHKIFKNFWRGLETPRHLNIFNPNSLKLLMKKTEIKNIYAKTSSANAEILSIGSFYIANKNVIENKKKSDVKIHIYSLLLHLLIRFIFIFKSSVGDECILIGKK